MSGLKVGDIVARKSYGCDILFKVVDIKEAGNERMITLKGVTYRIQADSPEDDLLIQPEFRVNEYNNKVNRVVDRKCRSIEQTRQTNNLKKNFFRDASIDNNRKFSNPGRVLHIDGDNDYLETCLKQYKKFSHIIIQKAK